MLVGKILIINYIITLLNIKENKSLCLIYSLVQLIKEEITT